MPLRSYKPTSPGVRFMTRPTFEEITTDQPHKPLLEPMKRGSGRNAQGRMTVRHRGGGEKRNYRRIDFRRDKWDVPAKLATIEYDPNRSARIGLLHYADGEKRYILVPNGLKVGDTVIAGQSAEARVGNALPLSGATRHADPQHRAGARQGRPDRPLGRCLGTAAGQGSRLGADPVAIRRGSSRRHALHGHRRPGRQPGP